jgi:hypothetical protein
VQRDILRVRAVTEDALVVVPRTSTLHGSTAPRTPFSLVAVIEVIGTNFALRSPDDQLNLVASYQALLKALPPEDDLHLLITKERRDLTAYITPLERLGANMQAPAMYRTLASAHADHLREIGTQRPLVDHHCYVVLRAASMRTPRKGLPSLFSRRRTRERLTQQALSHQMDLRIDTLLTQVSAMGLQAHRLCGEELVRLAYRCLTPERAQRHPLPSSSIAAQMQEDSISSTATHTETIQHVSLADLLAPAAIEERPDFLCIEGEYARGIALVDYPRQVTAGWLAPLILDDTPFDLSLHLHPQDAAQVVRDYRRRRVHLRASRQFQAAKGWESDPHEQVAEGDVGELLPKLARREERLYATSGVLLVRAPDLATLDERTDRVMETLKTLLLVGRPTTFEQLAAFASAQPLCDDVLRRTIPLDTRSLAMCFPFLAHSLVMPGGVLEGMTAHGEPVIMDDWADDLDNPHRFIGAITGAGKSYACKLKLLREALVRYDEGLQQVIIDPEQEYDLLVRECGGTVVRLAPGSPHHLNPFDLVPPGVDLSTYVAESRGDRLAEKVQALHTLYDLLLADHSPTGVTTLSVREKGLLDRVTYETYRQAGITNDPQTHARPAPLLRDLFEVLGRGDGGKDEYGLTDRLARYVEGSLAGTFSAPTDVRLDERMVVFDVRDMTGELRPVGMFLIADSLWSHVLTSLRPRVLYIDEAWSLIQHPEGGRFLADLSRRARKRYLRIVTITQSPERFVDDPWGAIIAGNAATKLLKKQDRTSALAVASRFQLTTAERHHLLQLQKPEALVMTGGTRLIMTIEANALEHRLATTNPREKAAWQTHLPPAQRQWAEGESQAHDGDHELSEDGHRNQHEENEPSQEEMDHHHSPMFHRRRTSTASLDQQDLASIEAVVQEGSGRHNGKE